MDQDVGLLDLVRPLSYFPDIKTQIVSYQLSRNSPYRLFGPLSILVPYIGSRRYSTPSIQRLVSNSVEYYRRSGLLMLVSRSAGVSRCYL